jgi:hypothetical protein
MKIVLFALMLMLAVIGVSAVSLIKSAPVKRPALTMAELGRWKTIRTKSVLDESVQITLRLTAEEKIQAGRETSLPELNVRCKEGKLGVYIDNGAPSKPEADLGDEHTVRIRLDNQESIAQRWKESTNKGVLYAPEGQTLADQLVKAKSFHFEFTPLNSGPATVRFDVVGLERKLEELKTSCSSAKR